MLFDFLRGAVLRTKAGARGRARTTRKPCVEFLEGREVPAALVLPETVLPSFSFTTPDGGDLRSGGNFLGSLNGNVPLKVSYSLDINANFAFFAGTAAYPNAAVTADGTTYGSPVPNAGVIAWLITNIGPTATTPEEQDALQAAIWRTEYGDGFQLDGVDNGFTQPPDSINAKIAPIYRADLAALGHNTAAVSAVSWISPGTTGFSTLNGPALVALTGPPVAQVPATLTLPQTELPTFSASFPINEAGQIVQSGGDLSAGNFGGLLNGNIPLPVSYCVNIYTNLFPGMTYTNATVTSDGTTYANVVPNAGAISWLVTNIGPTATTPEQQDALQAAIWRTEYGDGFQLVGVDDGGTASGFNATIAPIYKADLAALGNNTAPVSAVTWISPGRNPDGTQGQALVALTGPPINNGGGGGGGGGSGTGTGGGGGGGQGGHSGHHHHPHHPHHPTPHHGHKHH
jgi:hypothetical protein